MEILQIELVVLGLVCFFVLKSFVCRKISVTYISEIKVKRDILNIPNIVNHLRKFNFGDYYFIEIRIISQTYQHYYVCLGNSFAAP